MISRRFQGARQTMCRQRGVAILTITVILLLVVTIATLMVARVGLFEQKVVGTDVRSKEVYSAAIGGLEYGVNFFKENYSAIAWSGGDANGVGATGAPSAKNNTVLTADTYQHGITYTLKSHKYPDEWEKGNPRVITVTSTATAVNDSHVTKTVQVDVIWGLTSTFKKSEGGGPGVLDAPPVVVEGCFNDGGVTGTPDLYPNITAVDGVAIMTTQGLADGGTVEDCLVPGHFELCEVTGGNQDDCYPPDEYSEMTQTAYRAGLIPSQSLWSSIFGSITESDLRAMEKRDPVRTMVVDNTYPHYSGQPGWNSGSSTWTASVGSEDEPVILYFDSSIGCPGMTGTLTIWGLVYIEEEDCDNNGWGQVTIYGTLAQAGDLMKLSANTEVHGKNLDFFNPGGGDGSGDDTIDDPPGFISRITVIPGSWRDFTDDDF